MTYKGGFGDGYAGTAVLEPPRGGGAVITHYVPPRPRPAMREGRAVILVTVETTTGGAGIGPAAEVDLTVAARAYDRLLEERRDRLVLAAALAEKGARGWYLSLPLGQEADAWDRWRAEQAEALKRRFLDPPGPGAGR